MGSLPALTHLSLRVVLQPRDPAALDAFIESASSPSSPNYRHFLSRGAFARRFGPTSATIAAVRTSLRADGLSVTGISSSHLVLGVGGTARTVSRALHTSFGAWRLADGADGYQIDRSALLPAAVARDVAGIAGLSSLVVEHSFAIRRAPGHSVRRSQVASSAAGSHVAAPVSCSAAVDADPPGTFLPPQEGQAYGLTTIWRDGDLGTGLSVALVEYAPYSTSDILAYDKCFQLVSPSAKSDPNLRNVLVDGGTSPGSSGGSDEPTLDIEELRSLAPGAKVVVYEGPNNVDGPIDMLQQIASADTSQAVSISWGVCEAFSEHAAETPLFEQLAAQGQTVFAASGDSGSSDCIDETPLGVPSLVGPAVDDPSSQPWVTGVGALTVTDLSPLAQTVWNQCTGGNVNCGGGASGGGYSSVYPHPAWQVAPGVPSGKAQGAGFRDDPDVSVIGDPNTGMLAYYQQSYEAYGGTSMGAPLMAALDVDAAQACGVSTFGFLNPLLYSLAHRSGDYDNVTTPGNNAVTKETLDHHQFFTDTGYSMATGLGSPDPRNFINAMCTADATASATPTTPSTSSVWTVTFHAGGSAYAPGTKVTITAPAGTALPALASAPTSWEITTSEGTDAPSAVSLRRTSLSTTDNVVVLTLAQGSPSIGKVSVVATGVVNPNTVGTASVKITDSVDTLTEMAPLALSSGTPSNVVVGVTTAPPEAAIGTSGVRVEVHVTDALGAAVAGVPVTVRSNRSAVARPGSTTTGNLGQAVFVVRDDRAEVATISVTAGGAVGTERVAFANPWTAVAVSAGHSAAHVVGVPSIVATSATGDGFAGIARTSSDGLVLIRSVHDGAVVAPLVASTPLPPVLTSPTLRRIGRTVAGVYRSTRGQLIVCTSSLGALSRPWRVVDLTERGLAPPITGTPNVIVVGGGAGAPLSIAAIDTHRAIVAVTLRATSPTHAHLLDVSRLAADEYFVATGNVAQVDLGGSVGYFVRTTNNVLLFYARIDGAWLWDNVAADAQLYGAASVDTGDPTATVQDGIAIVVVTDKAHNVVFYEGSFGSWTPQVLAVGSTGISAPAGERTLPGIYGQLSLDAKGVSSIGMFGTSHGHRLYELSSVGVADSWASYDLTSLTRLPATGGVVLLPGAGLRLLGAFSGRLFVLRGPA